MPSAARFIATAASTLILAAGAGASPALAAHSARRADTSCATHRQARHERSAGRCRKKSSHSLRKHAVSGRLTRVHTRRSTKTTTSTNTTGAAKHADAKPAHTKPSAVEEVSGNGAAAVIAAVLATPCQNTELTPNAADMPLVRSAILCLINQKRAENGVLPLIANAELEQAAESHCQELIADNYFAHVSPAGETPVDRIRGTGYIPNPDVGYIIGENLAWGTYELSTPKAIAAAWFASPEHLANILEREYRETGIGVIAAVPAYLAEGAPGATYAQEFGVIVK